VVVAEIPDDGLAEAFGLLERDEPVAAADERVAAEPPLVDRFEQEGRAGRLAQAEVGRERCEEVDVEFGDCHLGNEKRPLSGSSVERCGLSSAFGYARRLPPRSRRHAHQLPGRAPSARRVEAGEVICPQVR
jgi:hypothetical protein